VNEQERPDEPRPRARDLVRKRSRSYRAPETGRHHHIGAAPERQPVLGEQGPSYVGTSAVQLAARTVAQLQAQRARLERDMAAAAEALRFEQAAHLRDELDRVDAELARRR
jgi:excinuclease UvrABC helicase subunit UvrB